MHGPADGGTSNTFLRLADTPSYFVPLLCGNAAYKLQRVMRTNNEIGFFDLHNTAVSLSLCTSAGLTRLVLAVFDHHVKSSNSPQFPLGGKPTLSRERIASSGASKAPPSGSAGNHPGELGSITEPGQGITHPTQGYERIFRVIGSAIKSNVYGQTGLLFFMGAPGSLKLLGTYIVYTERHGLTKLLTTHQLCLVLF